MLRTLSFLRPAFALLALPAVAPAQQTWVVQGGGFAFTAAVQQAAAGDTLLVRAGVYNSSFVDKGLTVLCDPGVNFTPSTPGPALAIGVPAGQSLIWSGGRVVTFNVFFTAFVTHGEGFAQYTDLQVAGPAGSQGRQVGFQRCSFGAMAVDGRSTPTSTAFSDCRIQGSLTLHHAAVDLANGSVDTRVSLPFELTAVTMSGSSVLTLVGDAQVLSNAPAGSQVPAVQATGGTVVYAPTVRFAHSTPQPVQGASLLICSWLPAVSSVAAGGGQVFRATVRAEPGSSTHLLLDLPAPITRLRFGALWIGQGSFVIDSGIVPANGTRSAALLLPTSLPPNVPVVVQTITTLTSGQLRIGPPTVELLK